MPAPERYLDDFSTGQTFDLGRFRFTESEIIEFAERFDPQPFHIDPEAAKDSLFGGLIASGWHTAAAVMRLTVDNFIPREASMGSPGIDELRWTKPVRPDVDYQASYLIEDVVPSTSKPDRGHIKGYLELVDPEGDVVMAWRARLIFRRRP